MLHSLLPTRDRQPPGIGLAPPGRGRSLRWILLLVSCVVVWSVAPSRAADTMNREGASGLDLETERALQALGYLGGVETAPERSGVVHYDPGRVEPGVNLFVSGHAPYAALLDLDGSVLHEWTFDGASQFNLLDDREYYRRVRLLENGDLLAIFDPYGIVRIDSKSRLVWSTSSEHLTHHDLDVDANGTIYVLGKTVAKGRGRHRGKKIFSDQVVIFDSSGKLIDRISIRDAFRDTPFEQIIANRVSAHIRNETGAYVEDFHVNTIQVLDGSMIAISPLFAKGNMLMCSPFHRNAWIIDGRTKKVVWNWIGPFTGQIHEVTLLKNANLLLFDNGPYGMKLSDEIGSEAVEFDMQDAKVVWRYGGQREIEGSRFYSATSSTVQRLGNGNTMIVASEPGRSIEVTQGGDVVWEHFNPFRTGRGGDLIAAVFQMERVPLAFVRKWLRPVLSRVEQPSGPLEPK